MRVFAALLVAALVAVAGCKKSRSYDRTTPEATLRSFFAALDDGKIPEDINLFVADEVELSSWRMRCKERGCERGELGSVQVADQGPMSATLLVDYAVFGKDRGQVMGGKSSPIRLRREGDVWRIVQFGRRIRIEPGATAPRGDGGPATDGGAAAAASDAGAAAAPDAGAAQAP